jgi:hypothetical protein
MPFQLFSSLFSVPHFEQFLLLSLGSTIFSSYSSFPPVYFSLKVFVFFICISLRKTGSSVLAEESKRTKGSCFLCKEQGVQSWEEATSAGRGDGRRKGRQWEEGSCDLRRGIRALAPGPLEAAELEARLPQM